MRLPTRIDRSSPSSWSLQPRPPQSSAAHPRLAGQAGHCKYGGRVGHWAGCREVEGAHPMRLRLWRRRGRPWQRLEDLSGGRNRCGSLARWRWRRGGTLCEKLAGGRRTAVLKKSKKFHFNHCLRARHESSNTGYPGFIGTFNQKSRNLSWLSPNAILSILHF